MILRLGTKNNPCKPSLSSRVPLSLIPPLPIPRPPSRLLVSLIITARTNKPALDRDRVDKPSLMLIGTYKSMRPSHNVLVLYRKRAAQITKDDLCWKPELLKNQWPILYISNSPKLLDVSQSTQAVTQLLNINNSKTKWCLLNYLSSSVLCMRSPILLYTICTTIKT